MCHSHSTTMDPDTCQATYLLGLNKTHALHEQSVATKILQQWHKNARELAGWLHSTNIGRKLHNCLSEDIMVTVYFTTHWLPTHAGTTSKTGHRLSAPGSLSGVKSTLKFSPLLKRLPACRAGTLMS